MSTVLSLDTLLETALHRHRIPGASLAVLADGELRTAASGVLNQRTGVVATTSSLFQIGSVSKTYTATVVMRLVERGLVTLDTPVADVVPGFRVADPEVARTVTVRHLLTHTSGLAGDRFIDTGRGDDVLERCVERYADLGQDLPLGRRWSYCNSGFVILGRVIEVLTGQTWDEALRSEVLEPLGLEHSFTLPEDLLRFRVALGHVGDPPEPAATWALPRSLGPAGLITSTAADLVRFARMHLEDGRGPGGPLLSPESVAAMRQPEVRLDGLSGRADAFGLGWMLFDWDGKQVVGHDGGTIGQYAFLRTVPEDGVAIALLTNGGMADDCFRDLCGDLLAETCGLRVPPTPTPDPAPLLGDALVGAYEQVGMRLTIERRGDDLIGIAEPLDEIDKAASGERSEFAIRPQDVAAGRYLVRSPGVVEQGHAWCRLGFFEVDGVRYAHLAGRAMRQLA